MSLFATPQNKHSVPMCGTHDLLHYSRDADACCINRLNSWMEIHFYFRAVIENIVIVTVLFFVKNNEA